jgi:hypothetical protein
MYHKLELEYTHKHSKHVEQEPIQDDDNSKFQYEHHFHALKEDMIQLNSAFQRIGDD